MLIHRYGSAAQKQRFLPAMLIGEESVAFGLTEPDHGSDATWLETTAVRDGGDWALNGGKRFNTGLHRATTDLIFARTSGRPGGRGGVDPARRRARARGTR